MRLVMVVVVVLVVLASCTEGEAAQRLTTERPAAPSDSAGERGPDEGEPSGSGPCNGFTPDPLRELGLHTTVDIPHGGAVTVTITNDSTEPVRVANGNMFVPIDANGSVIGVAAAPYVGPPPQSIEAGEVVTMSLPSAMGIGLADCSVTGETFRTLPPDDYQFVYLLDVGSVTHASEPITVAVAADGSVQQVP